MGCACDSIIAGPVSEDGQPERRRRAGSRKEPIMEYTQSFVDRFEDSDDSETGDKPGDSVSVKPVTFTEEEIMTGIKDAIDADDVGLLEDWTNHCPLDTPFIIQCSGHEMLEDRGSEVISALMYCIVDGKYGCVTYLLSSVSTAQLAVNFSDPETGDTALHWAVDLECIELLGVLIAKGADKNAVNNKGETPLDICKKNGDSYEIHNILEPYAPKMDFSASMYEVQSSVIVSSQSHKDLEEMFKYMESPPLSPETDKIPPSGSLDPGSPILRASGAHLLTGAASQSLKATEAMMDNLYEQAGHRIKQSVTSLEREGRLASLYVERSKLPKIAGWLEKKAAAFYKKRWVVCCDGYMLWSEKRIDTLNANDPEQRMKFKHELYLLHLKSVKPVETKASNKFEVVRYHPVKKISRTDIWRAKDRAERDQWVNALQKQKDFIRNMISYLRK